MVQTCRRPVLDIASDVNDGILLAVGRWTEGAALPDTHAVRRCRCGVHRALRHAANLHAYDKTTTRPHAQPHRRCDTSAENVQHRSVWYGRV